MDAEIGARDSGEDRGHAGSSGEPPILQRAPVPHRLWKAELKALVVPTLLLGAGAVTMDVTSGMFLAPGVTLAVGVLGLGLGLVLTPTSNQGLGMIFGPIYLFGPLWMLLVVLDALRPTSHTHARFPSNPLPRVRSHPTKPRLRSMGFVTAQQSSPTPSRRTCPIRPAERR